MKSETSAKDLHISDEWEICAAEPIHYGKVTVSADGYFLITGSLELEIDELENIKNSSGIKYEFFVRTSRGENGTVDENGQDAPESGTVNIVIHRLKNTIHIKSIGGDGGDGGSGKDGGNGGEGGNGSKGGNGGNGGNGNNGAKGGNGGDAPNVKITCTPAGADIAVLTLAKDDSPCAENISYGGNGGRGGEGGRGGQEGRGGLGADGKTAPNGKPGAGGKPGKSGKDGNDGKVVVIMKKGEESCL